MASSLRLPRAFTSVASFLPRPSPQQVLRRNMHISAPGTRVSYFPASSAKHQPYEGSLHLPHGSPPLRHALYIDVGCSQISRSRPTTIASEDDFGAVFDPKIVSEIRNAVAGGDVDAVVLYNTSDEPMNEIWRALQGAQPWHLEMASGWDERVWYEGLEDVTPRWPLKSVYLASYFGGGNWVSDDVDPEGSSLGSEKTRAAQPPSFPACYADIESLILDYPYWRELFFYPKGGSQNLRSLTICVNDVLETFACTVVCNPEMSKTLRSLTLANPAGCQTEPVHIDALKSFLRSSSALQHLELVLPSSSQADVDPWPAPGGLRQHSAEQMYAVYQEVYPWIGLHSCLPPTIQFFSLCAPATRLSMVDLQNWITKARDPTWLPNLKTFAFSLAMDPDRLIEVEEGLEVNYTLGREEWRVLGQEKAEVDAKVEELLRVMRERGVNVVEPRGEKETHYPLPFDKTYEQ